MTSGISIVDLGLNEFRLDLLEYMKQHKDIETAPKGLHTVVGQTEDSPAGVIFVLRNINDSVNIDNRNRIHPFYMVYISEESEIVCDYLNPKKLLDTMRLLCRGNCKDVKKMLDYLGVTEELLLNDLSENDEKNLRNFTGAVLYNRKIGFPNMEQDQFYGAFKIANLVIWIWAKRQSDGMYSIDSFFKLHQIALFTEDDVDLKKPIQASQFVLFDKKGLVHISNMDYEMVYSGITQTLPSAEYCTKVNFLVLDTNLRNRE